MGPVMRVKLGMGLIRGMASSERADSRLKKVIRCARSNGITVVALAVDKADILPQLYALGIDYIQGYFVSTAYGELIYPDAFNVEL